MTEFQQSRPEFVVAQAAIAAADHEFLDHDSFIGCDWLHHEYDVASLGAAFASDPRYRLVGRLSDSARQAVALALQGNVHIANKWLKLLKERWP
ncbi:TPA: hypothetical protein QEL11_003173 [Stenotrophomonas maltophilia]|nr:hypothetical protein [Stenotrophomonas maltophilia]